MSRLIPLAAAAIALAGAGPAQAAVAAADDRGIDLVLVGIETARELVLAAELLDAQRHAGRLEPVGGRVEGLAAAAGAGIDEEQRPPRGAWFR